MTKRFIDIDLLKEEIKGARFIKNPQFWMQKKYLILLTLILLQML
jgi:hypothetical protein